MARFVILRHEELAPPAGRPVILAIRDGFALLAFLFPLIWLLWHRLWVAALVVLAASIAIALFTQQAQWAVLALPLNLLLGLFVGLEAPGWRISAARLRDYRIADIVEVETQAEAELRFALEGAAAVDETPLKAAMVPGRGLAAADAPDFLFAAPGGVNR